MEVQHALVAFADTSPVDIGEQLCRAVGQRGDQVFGLLQIEVQLR
jgi:hypothetical protein